MLFYNGTKQERPMPLSFSSIISLADKINFAGYSWDIVDEGNLQPITAGKVTGRGDGSYKITKDGFVELYSKSASWEVDFGGAGVGCGTHGADSSLCMLSEDISNVDEFLIILGGENRRTINANSFIKVSLKDISTGNEIILFSDDGKSIKPKLLKVVNNFDGTYSLYSSLGVGDVFLKEGDFDVSSFNGISLKLCAVTLAFCRPDNPGRGGGSSESTLIIYNIITKRMEAPVCKADEVLLANGSCSNLEGLFLAREEAVLESFEEKLSRVEGRLLARQSSLEQQISDFRKLSTLPTKSEKLSFIDSRLAELYSELDKVKSDYISEINSLESRINEIESSLSTQDNSPSVAEKLESEKDELVKRLNFLKSTSPEKPILDQISFFESQKDFINSGIDYRVESLENELALTRNILEQIKSNEFLSIHESDIEEAISKIMKRADFEKPLSESEIRALVHDEVSKSSFRKKPYIPVLLFIIALVILAVIISPRKK